ncbi:MAG: hypothetical protein AAGF84_03165 [Planctomycetota bacterium]
MSPSPERITVPVVKHHEFTNKPTASTKDTAHGAIEALSEDHRLDPQGHGRLLQPINGAMDKADQRPEGGTFGGGVGLYLGLIVGAAIVLRILLASLGPAAQPELAMLDSVEYQLALGEAIIDGQGFALPAEHPAAPAAAVATLDFDKLAPGDLTEAHHALETLRGLRGETTAPLAGQPIPETKVLPGMPAVLGAYALTGLPLSWLVLLQCVLGGVMVIPAYAAARNLTNLPFASLVVALLVALHPGLITASLTLDGTVWAALLVVLGAASISWLYSDRPWLPTLGGLGIGGAALIQPWAWLAAPALVWWRLTKQRDLAGVGIAVFVLLGATVAPAAWVYRNQHIGAGTVLSSESRIDRAFGVPAHIAAHDPEGEFRNDRPAAIAAGWDAFVQRLDPQSQEGKPQLLNPFGTGRPTAPPPTFEATADTLTALRGHTLDAWVQDPAGFARYALHRTSQLMLAPSTDALLPHLGVPYERAGYLTNLIGRGAPYESADPITRWTTEVWIGLNALLFGAAGLGVLFVALRRQWGLLGLLLLVAGGLLLLTPTQAGEASRIPLLFVQGVAIAAIVIPPAPRRVKPKKKAKVGDFTAAAPDGGFTIGLRPETVAALGTSGSHRAKGLMENLHTLGFGKAKANDEAEGEGEGKPETAPHPYDALVAADEGLDDEDHENLMPKAPALAGIVEVNDGDDADDDEDEVYLGRPF